MEKWTTSGKVKKKCGYCNKELEYFIDTFTYKIGKKTKEISICYNCQIKKYSNEIKEQEKWKD